MQLTVFSFNIIRLISIIRLHEQLLKHLYYQLFQRNYFFDVQNFKIINQF
jgi:hypothetical protein